MPISFLCPECDQKLRAPEHTAGRRVTCPKCQSKVEVPVPDLGSDADLEVYEEETPVRPKRSSPAQPRDLNEPPPKKLSPKSSSAGSTAKSSASSTPGKKKPAEKPPEEQDDWGDLESALDDLEGAEDPEELDELDDEEQELPPARRKGKPEPVLKSNSKSKSKSKTKPVASDEGQPFRFHWVFLLGLIPLIISTFMGDDGTGDRLEKALTENPHIEEMIKNGEIESQTELLLNLPEQRLPGSFLPRDTLVHWLFALFAATGFLGILYLMFPGSFKRTRRLFLAGLFTGTVGICLLLLFQILASATQGVWVRGRGFGVLIFLVLKFIGFSYTCAFDNDVDFWTSFFGFTFGVGLCEEICKALPIIYYLNTNRKAGWRGACLVGLASGIGFGISEGIMYSSDMYNGMTGGLIYVVRFISCVSLHAMWSGSVALMLYSNPDAFSDAEDWLNNIAALVWYMGMAMILHGLYDTFLKHHLPWAAMLIGVGTYFWLLWLVQRSRGT